MEHILSLSYGKDSMACLGAIEILGWPLDRIVTADVWATDTIPAELPPMVEFKAEADAIIKERWGIEVEHVRAKLTAQEIMYHVRCSGNRPGQIMGWPMFGGCELQKPLKRQPIERAARGTITYLGIAADEPKRFCRDVEPVDKPTQFYLYKFLHCFSKRLKSEVPSGKACNIIIFPREISIS